MDMKRIPIILSCMLAVGACHHAELLQQAGMADFEGKLEEFGATRTILNGNTVRWCEGDRISIFEGNSYSNRYEAEGIAANSTTCRFVLKETTQQQGDRFQNNIALYPYSSDATVREMENAFLIGGVTLQDIQFHDYETFGSGAFPMVAVTGSLEDKVLDFKNVCGVLKLNLTGSETIGSITLTGNADEALAGPAEILAYHDRSPEIFIGENAAKSITLDCGAGVTLNTRESTLFISSCPLWSSAKDSH